MKNEIYAHEVRKGETAYIDEKGLTQMLFIELNSPIMTLQNSDDRELRIKLPKYENEVPIIYTLNLNQKEKEEAFDWLDMALHQKMYAELDDEVARCHSLIEELRDRIEHLEMEKAVIEYEGRVI